MAELGFDPATCHPARHRQILEVLHEVMRRLQYEGEAALGLIDAMVPALAEWFPLHTQSLDAGLALAMAERGFEPQAASQAVSQAAPQWATQVATQAG